MPSTELQEILSSLNEARATIITNHFAWWVEGAVLAEQYPEQAPIILAAIELKTKEVDAIIEQLDLRILLYTELSILTLTE